MNTFSQRAVVDVPSGPMWFTASALLTDASGEISLDFVINRLDPGEAIFRRTRGVNFPDPLHEHRFILPIQLVSFPTDGACEAVLFADGEMIARKRFLIIALEGFV